jgi:hypothetical protein
VYLPAGIRGRIHAVEPAGSAKPVASPVTVRAWVSVPVNRYRNAAPSFATRTTTSMGAPVVLAQERVNSAARCRIARRFPCSATYESSTAAGGVALVNLSPVTNAWSARVMPSGDHSMMTRRFAPSDRNTA